MLSPEGRWLFDMELGPVPLAFVDASDPEDVARVRELHRAHGEGWVEQWLSFERYGQFVSGNNFKMADLKSGKTDVFINLDLKTLRTHPGIGRVIVGALMNAIYEADGKTEGWVLFLIDKADTLGHMEHAVFAKISAVDVF